MSLAEPLLFVTTIVPTESDSNHDLREYKVSLVVSQVKVCTMIYLDMKPASDRSLRLNPRTSHQKVSS
jgi:hypothetical protein